MSKLQMIVYALVLNIGIHQWFPIFFGEGTLLGMKMYGGPNSRPDGEGSNGKRFAKSNWYDQLII